MRRILASRFALAAATASMLVSCASEEASPPGATSGSGVVTPVGAGGGSGSGGATGEGGDGAGGDDVLEGPCPLGSSRACKVHHESGCAEGRQLCIGGEWTECLRERSGRAMVPRSLDDDPVDCSSPATPNTCDPGCQAILPDAPDLGGDGTTNLPDWETGTLGELPASVIADGIEEPCNDGRDCQFDHYCNEVTGQCAPFIPGQVIPACESGPGQRPDITLGVPCLDSVPLCNRGPVALTAAQTDSIRLKWRPAPGPTMEGCNIGQSTTCDVPAQELAPGECMNVACSMPEDVYVFADFAANQECECANNWTYSVDGACGEPSCGGDVGTASEIPLTLFVAFDKSGSMNDVVPGTGGRTRMQVARQAMNDFFRAPESAGLQVALRFWPKGDCGSYDGSPNGTNNDKAWNQAYEIPGNTQVARNRTCLQNLNGCWPNRTFNVPNNPRDACNIPSSPTTCDYADLQTLDDPSQCVHELTSATGAADPGENALVAAMNAESPVGATPMLIALQGGVDFVRRYRARYPEENAVLVLITDGLPEPWPTDGQTPNTEAAHEARERNVIIDTARTAFDANGVRTYVIGIPGAGGTFSNDVAAAGGTGAAFLISNAATASAELTAALQSIRNSFGCSYAVPEEADPSLITVRWSHDGTTTDLMRVDDAASCGGQPAYYFASGEEIVLCTATCEDVRAETSSVVELAVSCSAPPEPVTVAAEFSAENHCDDQIGTFPQWKILFYDADVPASSSIEVRARTKHFAADPYRDWHDVTTITEANEVSDLSSPTRLDTPLGNESFGEVIEIEMTTTVAGGAPTLYDYEVQFTCAPSE